MSPFDEDELKGPFRFVQAVAATVVLTAGVVVIGWLATMY